MLSIKNINVKYGDFIALKNISLELKLKEHVAIIGPSGAGKSTLLREIYRRIPTGANLIQQQFALVPQLKTFHNVYIARLERYSFFTNLCNLIKPNTQRYQEILTILKDLGIENKILTPVSQLSGGEQQRVAIARALYHGGNIILGDEPISAVDPHNSDIIMSTLSNSNKTFIFSVHQVEVALKFATRIIGMKDGQIFFDDAPGNIKRSQINNLYAPC